MSSQAEGLQDTQLALQQAAAGVIQKAWSSHVHREVFRYFKELISHCNEQDPQSVLKPVNPREAELLDAAAGVFIRFRLGGSTFPPSIYYKIFTHRPIADMCAGSPKDYTQPGLRKPVARQRNNVWPLVQEDRSGRYQRVENNSWRLFWGKTLPVGEHTEVGGNKTMDFHYSKLQRQQDVFRWKKRRRIQWLKQMYSRGRRLPRRHVVTPEENADQEVTGASEEEVDDDVLQWELDELLAWSGSLNFERYIEEWRHLARSHSSGLGRGVTSVRDVSCLLEEDAEEEPKLC